MKKLIIAIFTFITTTGISAQDAVYKSGSSIRSKATYETAIKDRQVFFEENQIKITNYTNGGKETLILDIEQSEKKEYSYDGICNWIYCHSTKKDEISQKYTKYIVIMPDSKFPRYINIFQVSDEVTIFHTKLLLN